METGDVMYISSCLNTEGIMVLVRGTAIENLCIDKRNCGQDIVVRVYQYINRIRVRG